MAESVFTLEGVETIRILKFKSKKMGLDFQIARREEMETTITIPLTLEEFKVLQNHPNPMDLVMAKHILKAENLRERKDGDDKLI